MKPDSDVIKFIYSEKATNLSETSTKDLSYVVTVKSTVEISQNFVVFSEYMNFNENNFPPFNEDVIILKIPSEI